MRLRYYLRNYAEFVKLNVQSWMEYRADFAIGIFAIFLTNVVTTAFFWVLFQHIPALSGWSFYQLLFMYGMLSLTFGIWHTFLTGCTAWEMDRLVRMGDLDRILLRPINTLALLTMKRIDDDGFGDIIAGVLFLWYSAAQLGIVWSVPALFALAVLALGGALVLLAINVVLAALAFWVTSIRSLMDLFWSLTRFAEYPINIYHPFVIWFLTIVVPFGFTSFYPSQFFFGNAPYLPYAYATLPFGLLLFGASYAFWSYGLKKYASTGH